mmetsp:Transcript_34004/g.73526  ORF Transcript_34004/g.73526 Transcript_34004/m.73526 type:complete len:89 (+) Transcript_34004:104-370(+)
MSESAKEQFRKYLESAGAIDTLVKVLVSLYEEPDKPKNSLDYIKASLGGPTPSEYESVVAERDNLQKRVAQLEEELAALRAEPAEAAE